MIKNYIWHLLNVKSPINSGIAIGFKAFLMMCLFAMADIFTGLFGKDLTVSSMIYGSFTSVVFAGFFKELYENSKGNKNLNNE
jgi:hypothetical protein